MASNVLLILYFEGRNVTNQMYMDLSIYISLILDS